jgi:hypothetical protein
MIPIIFSGWRGVVEGFVAGKTGVRSWYSNPGDGPRSGEDRTRFSLSVRRPEVDGYRSAG